MLRLKLLFVIDHFGSGGAQRQMVELARGLVERGHIVEFFIYYPEHDFFKHRLQNNIIIHTISKRKKGFSFKVLRQLSSLIKNKKYDIILAYLDSPNIYAELAKIISGKTILIVSERNSHKDDKSLLNRLTKRLLHNISNCIVTNNQTHAHWLNNLSWLNTKVVCIYNGTDLEQFNFTPLPQIVCQNITLLSVGRISTQKNILNLIKALQLFYNKNGFCPKLSWAGKKDDSLVGKQYYKQIEKLLKKFPKIRDNWHWLGQQSEIPKLLRQHHALIHPSFYEGLPNVVCEALSVGRPVLISNVCDHHLLVRDGKRGFLFNPENPADIANAIDRFTRMSRKEMVEMSKNARAYAEQNLSITKMVSEYEKLFWELKRRVPMSLT